VDRAAPGVHALGVSIVRPFWLSGLAGTGALRRDESVPTQVMDGARGRCSSRTLGAAGLARTGCCRRSSAASAHLAQLARAG
jgi:hypothetical protein